MLELNKVYNMNCIEGMKLIPDGSIDLTVTSPPYDNLRTYNWYSWDFEAVAKELFRVTKVWWIVVRVVWDSVVKWSETLTSFKQALFFKEIGFNVHDTMIFEKDVLAFPDFNRYYQKFEYMFVFSKWKPKTTNLIEDRRNIWWWVDIKWWYRDVDWYIKQKSGNKKGKKVKEMGIRFNIRKYNVWRNKSYKEDFLKWHPAIFPEKLAEDHIISWSNEWDTVLDPFMWSWTTAKMALINKRNYIWFELSKEYCDIIEARLKSAQTPLF